MRKWIVGAAVTGALLAVQPAAAQTAPQASPSQPALQLMLQKGVITQAEYDAAMKASEVVIQRDTTVVVKETPKVDAPPVTSKWNASMYGFIEADFIYDSTQSFPDLAGNTIIQANGYAAKNHRL